MKRQIQALVATLGLTTSVAACSLVLDFSALECPSNQTACDGQCFDLDSASEHCGTCDVNCSGKGAASPPACVGGKCVLQCEDPFADCDQDPTNGCETDLRNIGGVCDAGVKLAAELPHGLAVVDKKIFWAEDLDGGDGEIRGGPDGGVICPGVSLPETLSYVPGDRQFFFATHQPLDGDIVRYSLDTGRCEHLWTDQSTRYGHMMAYDGGLYFGTWYGIDGGPPSGSILVGDLDASSAKAPEVLISRAGCTDKTCSAHSVWIDDSGLWWTDSYAGTFFHADIHGNDVVAVKDHLKRPGFIVADDDYVYFSENNAEGAIYAIEKAHPKSFRILADGLAWPDALALDADHVYWTSSSTTRPADCDADAGTSGGIWRIDKDANNGKGIKLLQPAAPWAIAIEDGTLYYTDTGCIGGQAFMVAVPLPDAGADP